jgi:osmotically-inducible protein OsmY
MPRIDEEIKKDVVDQLYWDDRVDASNIKVEVNNGEVNLSGTVPYYSNRRIAQNDSWNVLGVRALENRLKVDYPETIPLPSDDQIQANLIDMYRLDPELNHSKIVPEVNGGKVRLEGEVDKLWKKNWAEDLASGTMGVTEIDNRLTVVPTEDVLDSAIAEDLKAALARNIYVDVDDIDIKVENGVVTLFGTMPDWISARAAYNTALYTSGATEVINKMTIR